MRSLMVAQELNNILVVDDTPQNLHLLVDILTKYEYKVRPVPNGKLALSAAEINPPDLILLDIMMPDIDGYQVCKQLKTNPKTKHIPVIFISAINESVDKVKAFAIGGADYIQKPFQMHEVLIRVKNQLALVNLKDQLQARNEQLNETVNQLKKNQKQIIKVNKYLALEKITAGISQQVNNPLLEIKSSLAELNQFSESSLKDLPIFLQQLSPEQQKYFIALLKQARSRNVNLLLSTAEKQELKAKIIAKLERFKIAATEKTADILLNLGSDEEIEEFLPLLTDKDYLAILENAYLINNLHKSVEHIADSTDKFTKIIEALDNYADSQKTNIQKRQAHLKNTIEIALSSLAKQMPKGIQIMRNYGNLPAIYCYPEELQKLWFHLIQNALEAIGSLGILTINLYQQQNNLIVDIIDTGEGIEPEVVQKMCDPFFTTKFSGDNTGLGLTIAKQIIEHHEGSITVNVLSDKATLPGKTKFTVSLPIGNDVESQE
ncbi:hybrid sensor histidine kinase/response regulator [Pleurocapsa sp. FMAR1]|uniref:hybrid sensor histidine kinase/response regulator n=1 Tax=Pleurocapsa sp. FMAR1 TaxID=3040204 RepID=UPI0029C8B057|nr:response regulator [Pleurocapsa sp. FMAR1]